MPEVGCYIYVISRGLAPETVQGVVGLDGQPVRVISHRGLDAIVSAVDLQTYGEEGLRENLEDLRWLETVARRHDDVVQAIARRGPAAPMRLATICHDDDAVRARLEEWHGGLVKALDRVVGRGEWSVKLIVPSEPDATPATADAAPAESGAAYLRRKKEQVQRRTTSHDQSVETANRAYSELAELAVASRRLQPQDPRLTGLDGTMTLNAAFLVETEEETVFQRRLHDLEHEVAPTTVQFAGPWPPYSFATLEG